MAIGAAAEASKMPSTSDVSHARTHQCCCLGEMRKGDTNTEKLHCCPNISYSIVWRYLRGVYNEACCSCLVAALKLGALNGTPESDTLYNRRGAWLEDLLIDQSAVQSEIFLQSRCDAVRMSA